MNKAIKLLEKIGQSTSLNQHEGLIEMLEGLKIKPESLMEVQDNIKEFVCVIFPEDDDDDEGEEK